MLIAAKAGKGHQRGKDLLVAGAERYADVDTAAPSMRRENAEADDCHEDEAETTGAAMREPEDDAAQGRRREKVCAWCGVERPRFDHHCLFINACVYERTHREFVAMLALAVNWFLGFGV